MSARRTIGTVFTRFPNLWYAAASVDCPKKARGVAPAVTGGDSRDAVWTVCRPVAPWGGDWSARNDVDLVAGVITIQAAKFDRSRLVPLHPTATEALDRCAAERGASMQSRAREPSSSPAAARLSPAAA
jgi:hypothetical protein